MNRDRFSPLPEFKPNEPINSRQLGKIVTALKKPMQGVNSPRQTNQGFRFGPVIDQLIIVSVDGDFLLCNTWDGAVQGDDDIKVAKPFLLRKNTFDGTDDGTYTYAFTDNQTMTVTKKSDSTTETWKVTLSYDVEDLIMAVACVRGGIDLTDSSGVEFDYMDLNTDARAWAKSS